MRSRSFACALGAPTKHRAPPNTAAAKAALPNMDFKIFVNIASSRASPGLLSGCALYFMKHPCTTNVARCRKSGAGGDVREDVTKTKRAQRNSAALRRKSKASGEDDRGRARPNRVPCAIS